MKEYIVKVDEQKAEDGSQKILETKELVRCKDCKHGMPSSDGLMLCNKGVYFDRYKKSDWFCADGKR